MIRPWNNNFWLYIFWTLIIGIIIAGRFYDPHKGRRVTASTGNSGLGVAVQINGKTIDVKDLNQTTFSQRFQKNLEEIRKENEK
ncbi:MAG: hypothetical protein KAQ94_02725 [Arcobacteraceae bacterium]|nr:hypothetical protein [Arcobacteraceae bacterium]